jgi:hypothetical protein
MNYVELISLQEWACTCLKKLDLLTKLPRIVDPLGIVMGFDNPWVFPWVYLVMGTGLRTRAGLRVRVTRVRVRVTISLPVTFPYPFRRVTGM